MNYEDTPIQTFVAARYSTPSVQKIVDTWRVEPQQVIEKVVEFFREMGIYRVPFHQERLIMMNMLQLLKNSPDILKMVAKANNEELKRQRSRHAV